MIKCTRPELREGWTDNSYYVPCGYCPVCRKYDRESWKFRIQEEYKHSQNAWFLTVTYNDDNLPFLTGDGEIIRGVENARAGDWMTLVPEDATRFVKSIQKKQARAYREYKRTLHRDVGNVLRKPRVKYFIVGEYGSKTKRPHYHIILFNLLSEIAKQESLEKTWSDKKRINSGYIQVKPLIDEQIGYVANYIHDKWMYDEGLQIKPFRRPSKGLGEAYLTPPIKKHHRALDKLYVRTKEGYKIRLPKYYINKIWTEQEILELYKRLPDYGLVDDSELPTTKDISEQRVQTEYSIKSRISKRNKNEHI